jgi:hypothetical protein
MLPLSTHLFSHWTIPLMLRNGSEAFYVNSFGFFILKACKEKPAASILR